MTNENQLPPDGRLMAVERRPAAPPEDCRWFADEVAIDFPSIAPVVGRIRRAFVEEDQNPPPLRAEIVLSRHEAREGVDVPIDIPIRSTCTTCGGRGETWMEDCRSCQGSGEATAPHRLRVSIPPGVLDGAHFAFSVGRAAAPTRIEVHIAVRASATS